MALDTLKLCGSPEKGCLSFLSDGSEKGRLCILWGSPDKYCWVWKLYSSDVGLAVGGELRLIYTGIWLNFLSAVVGSQLQRGSGSPQSPAALDRHWSSSAGMTEAVLPRPASQGAWSAASWGCVVASAPSGSLSELARPAAPVGMLASAGRFFFFRWWLVTNWKFDLSFVHLKEPVNGRGAAPL